MISATNSKTVLIVEDEPALREALLFKLSSEGYHIREAHDGEEGLRLALEEHPDLILLDIIMPKMDGISMLHRLRLDEWGKSARVIVLSNLNDDVRVTEALANGVHDYLVKTDWKIDDVAKKVSSFLC